MMLTRGYPLSAKWYVLETLQFRPLPIRPQHFLITLILFEDVRLKQSRVGVIFAIREVSKQRKPELKFDVIEIGVAEEQSHGQCTEEGAVYFVGAVLNSDKLIAF